ncbi:hypothetical protein [Haloferax sp. DFSO60]|uniref:hypothetical protein n=1 Tax=Haloferax sp. DFSO60 TaxID=3388652 RepID=UPI00397CF385
MTYRIEPAEEYDGRISVHLLDDDAGREEIRCSSYREAIEVIKTKQQDVTVAKIIDRDDEVVFSSHEMDIDNWQSVWENEKRRLRVDVEEYDCPYDSISCFVDDLCVQCKMDKLQNRV